MKKLSKGSMHVIRADIGHMPFRDCVFGVVYNEGVVEHFQRPFCILNEMARVLQRLGVLIFSVPNTLSFHTPARSVATKLHYYIAAGIRFYGFERSFSKSEMRCLLRLVELENVEVHGIGLLFGVGRNMPHTIRTLLYQVYLRLRDARLGRVLTECFGFQIVGKGEKQT
jgi:SAM-dependent methyltransferase